MVSLRLNELKGLEMKSQLDTGEKSDFVAGVLEMEVSDLSWVSQERSLNLMLTRLSR